MPYLFVRPYEKKFAFFPWDFTSIYYGFNENEKNVLTLYEKAPTELDYYVEKEKHKRKTGMEIHLEQLKWYDTKLIDKAYDIYHGESQNDFYGKNEECFHESFLEQFKLQLSPQFKKRLQKEKFLGGDYIVYMTSKHNSYHKLSGELYTSCSFIAEIETLYDLPWYKKQFMKIVSIEVEFRDKSWKRDEAVYLPYDADRDISDGSLIFKAKRYIFLAAPSHIAIARQNAKSEQ